MVGLVFVSHSAKLAQGLKEIAGQMTRGQSRIAVAGGIDDPENPIGTDPAKICTAIESVYSSDGVLVLMDLGSALLSAETALELLGPQKAKHVKLCAAPLVEGAVAAAVQASIGASLDHIMDEALNALAAKKEQLAPAAALNPLRHSSPVDIGGKEIKQIVTVFNPNGLHARPAADFVKAASRFQADIFVTKETKTANAKSMNQIAALGAAQGEQIEIKASGPQAIQAVKALKNLVENKFKEKYQGEFQIKTDSDTTPGSHALENAKGAISGIPASAGIAIGPVVHYRSRMPEIQCRQIQDPRAEFEKLKAALAKARQELEQLKNQAARKVGATKAKIFDAQQMFLDDPVLLDGVKEKIETRQCNAGFAFRESIDAMTRAYRELDDAYLRERAADVVDMGNRVLRILIGRDLPALSFEKPVILFAEELTPSDTVQLDPAKVLAICTALGGGTSHSAIVAKALGIPAVVGLGPDIGTLPENTTLAVDGGQGLVWPNPAPSRLAEFERLRDAWLNRQQKTRKLALAPAATLGQAPVTIDVAANITGPHDAKTALDYGAQGVGLFRTEFMFLGRSQAPALAEQIAVFSQVAGIMQSRPLVIRTVDVGADKRICCLDMEPEDNPFLGLKGIRFCLAHPDMFKTQLTAILTASPGHNFKLMFPMISTIEEFYNAKAILDEVKQTLRTCGTPFDEHMEVGMMIEVPSAVAVADQLAVKADFFSIGSNDLTQYIMGADRGNPKVSHLVNALNPAVLRMVAQTAGAARKAGIWVGMCGELAANPLAAPLLIGLGLDELSMSAPNIPQVKNAIRRCTMQQAKELARSVLNLETARQVETYLRSNLPVDLDG